MIPTKNIVKIGDVDYIAYSDPQIQRPSYMLVGLPDAGLVGQIAVDYLIRTNGFQEIGEVDLGDLVNPFTQVEEGIAKSPMRVFHKANIIAVNSWVPIPSTAILPVSRFLVALAKHFGIGEVISITGLPINNRLDLERLSAYWISNNKDLVKNLSSIDNFKEFGNGYIVGPYSRLLLEAKREDITNFVITVESFLDLPDPEAASVALGIVSQYTGNVVNTEGLLKEAEEVRARIKELMVQTKKQMQEYDQQKPLTFS